MKTISTPTVPREYAYRQSRVSWSLVDWPVNAVQNESRQLAIQTIVAG